MSDGEGVIFMRSEGADEDEDIWDDTALIEAYDRAISMVKESIDSGRVAAAGGVAASGCKAPRSAKRQKKPKRDNGRPAAVKVEVGDRCQAIYSEDGLWYEGEVVAVDHDTQSCVVRYTGYGNEEEHCVSDIVLTDAGEASPPDSSDKDRHKMEWSPHSLRHGGEASMAQHREVATTVGHSKEVHLPSIPPPPPLLGSSEGDADEGSALSSMLISWYMSGYHTGYYQGLKDGKKQSSESRKQH